MNMPPPPIESSMENHLEQVQDAYEAEAQHSMNEAAEEIAKIYDECSVRVDGTWQRRRHS